MGSFAVLGADVVQKTMKEIRVATSSRPVPLSYTELRTAAYDRLLFSSSSLSSTSSSSPPPPLPEGGYSADAHAAFRCWIDARNAASEELLFADAVYVRRYLEPLGGQREEVLDAQVEARLASSPRE